VSCFIQTFGYSYTLENDALRQRSPVFSQRRQSFHLKNLSRKTEMLTPLTNRFCPFTQAASGLAKKATTGAMSSTLPIRFAGCVFAMAVMTCSGFPSLNS
jgi:hypothetical protein